MKVVSLKRDTPDMRECEPCDYPWSLRITLHSDTLEKLGMDKLPNVLDIVQLAGSATVVSVTDDGMERRVELQITDLGVDKPKKAASSVLYDKTD